MQLRIQRPFPPKFLRLGITLAQDGDAPQELTHDLVDDPGWPARRSSAISTRTGSPPIQRVHGTADCQRQPTVRLYVRAGSRRASRVSISSLVKVKSKMSRLSRM